jgi:serine/threonine protein kinase/formylglycine-generating enzyme required for sulfatase activity
VSESNELPPSETERFARLRELVEDALERPPETRRVYLEARCSDPDLLDQALALVEGLTEGSFLQSPALGAAARPLSLVGQRFGEFELLAKIGRGGMGVVYRARQTSLGRDVAVKLISSPKVLASERSLERFRREARTAAQIDHPSIARVLTHGEERGIPFLAMELVEGDTLAHRIAHEALPSALPAIRDRARWVMEIARALDVAHAARVVHRDVKPANVLITQDGTPKLVDFGIARDERFGSLSEPGDFVGTPQYMSPEQLAAGRDGVDERTDIYSLGVVLFEALSGERPYDGENPFEMLAKIQTRSPRRLRSLNPSVPVELGWIVDQAIEVDRAHRYSSARNLADDLDAFVNGRSPVHAGPKSARRRLSSWLLRRRRWVAGAVIVLLSAALLRASMRPFDVPSSLLSLSTVPAGLPVFAVPIDPSTSVPLEGADRSLGRSPLVDARLPLGAWRIEVVSERQRLWGERADAIEAGRRIELPRFHVRQGGGASQAVPRGTVRIHSATVELGPFSIDTEEVSNRRYEAFVRDTGHRAPEIWPSGWDEEGLPESWRELPVVTVDFFDARAFAAWAGRRLPTREEWLLAASSGDGRRFPWGDVFGELHRDPSIANVRWEGRRTAEFRVFDEAGAYDAVAAREAYLAMVEPVQQGIAWRSAFGLARCLGNVREWTASPSLEFDRPVIGAVTVLGSSWHGDVQSLSREFSSDRVASSVELGFRCAGP